MANASAKSAFNLNFFSSCLLLLPLLRKVCDLSGCDSSDSAPTADERESRAPSAESEEEAHRCASETNYPTEIHSVFIALELSTILIY